eukprot:448000-Alexandrium_andersonii.AAC.1
MRNEPCQRPIQEVVLVGAAQPATTGRVVDNRPAIAGNGDPRPRGGSLEQQLDGEASRPRFSHDC